MIENYPGKPLTWQRIAPGDTLAQIAAGVWKYKELEIGYDSGDYAFLEGDVIVGATSGAIGIVVSVTVVTGTVAGGDAAGKIRFHSWNGIAFTNNEKIKVAADADVGDIDGTTPVECVDAYLYKETVANLVLVSAETNAQRIGYSARKMKPDQTSDYGLLLPIGGSVEVRDADAIKNLYTIDAVSGAVGYTVFTGYF